MTTILTHALAIAAGGLFVWLFLTRAIERRVLRKYAEQGAHVFVLGVPFSDGHDHQDGTAAEKIVRGSTLQ